jgi:hypothetical protein
MLGMGGAGGSKILLMTVVWVLLSLVGLGFVGLGATLVATARPRWAIPNRRNRQVPASVRWNGGAMLAVGGSWLAVFSVLPPGSDAATLAVALMFLALILCLLMAARSRDAGSH